MAHKRKKLGDWGEKVAMTQLQAAGYEILAQNWRCQIGEIDIIGKRGETVSFIEVKTRRGRGVGSPEESITPRKARKLIELALTWLGEQGDDELDWQIDLIAVELDTQGKLLRCEHIENFITS